MSQIAHFPTPSPPSLLPSSGFRPAGLLWVSQRRSLVPTQGCLPTVFPWPRMPSPHSGQLLLWAPYLCYFLSEVFPPCRLTSNRVPFIFLFFLLFSATPAHMEVPRIGVQSALVVGLQHSNAGSVTYTMAHGNARSLTQERGQGSNPHSHGHYPGS